MTAPHAPAPGTGREVRTTAGRVRGRQEGGLAVFRGIPYAQAPTGEALFAPPGPAAAWDGVREALAFGPPPPQGTMPGMQPEPPVSGDEWLTVNVWTPAPGPASRLPVLVWVYGGAYMSGSADNPGYDAARLAHEGGLVVVTLNYRVGVLGFAHVEGAPANRGLLDQVAALTWVRENIAAFGGDPDRVTVFGESAGAGSIAALLAMPRATGLFQRAITQSVPGTYFSAELASDISAAIAAEVGLRPEAAALSGVGPHALTSAGDAVAARLRQYEDRWGPVAHTPTPFSPVVDGDVLAATPWQALAGGAARDIELITGHNRDEYRLFLALDGRLGTVTEEQAETALRVFAPGPDGARAFRAAYPELSAEALCERVQSDWLFRMPSLRLAEAQTAGGGRAHVYELTWPAPADGGVLGACHALDIPLTFGNLEAGLAPLFLGPEPGPGVSAEAEALSARFRAAWTAFAFSGDPGWPAYTEEKRLVRILDAEPEIVAYPEETSRRLWRDHPFAALPLLGT
ncbi:carboxylesterase/lipase family protein [Streptomyces daliensis]|uniref:Carboxylic ester hydrolase n=1 Tax=Streptomyces daliensis TaxID=299421 RepID=A0A8T4IIF8_9ACTN|nr:carboxylesterase family protein [Streptomyces daliensis]